MIENGEGLGRIGGLIASGGSNRTFCPKVISETGCFLIAGVLFRHDIPDVRPCLRDVLSCFVCDGLPGSKGHRRHRWVSENLPKFYNGVIFMIAALKKFGTFYWVKCEVGMKKERVRDIFLERSGRGRHRFAKFGDFQYGDSHTPRSVRISSKKNFRVIGIKIVECCKIFKKCWKNAHGHRSRVGHSTPSRKNCEKKYGESPFFCNGQTVSGIYVQSDFYVLPKRRSETGVNPACPHVPGAVTRTSRISDVPGAHSAPRP